VTLNSFRPSFNEGKSSGGVDLFMRWNKEKVKTALLDRIEKGLPIDISTIKKEDGKLRGAIETHFGNLTKALIYCEIDPDSVHVLTWWTKDKIKKEFLRYINENSHTSIFDISMNHKKLEHAVRKHYGTYENLCEDLGVDVSVVRKEGTSDSHYGKKFEKLLNDMFISIGKKYTYQHREFEGIIPDFYDESTNEIVDAKLSSWTVFNSNNEALTKYLPVCNKLTIVYLRGENIPHKKEKLELRHISYYYDELRKRGLELYITRFEELLAEVSQVKKEAV
jgi:hypothetical protein